LTLRAKKPVFREKLPDVLKTWGDWIKAQRVELRLTKRQLSLRLNVSDITIYLWEKNRVQPCLAQIPKIIEFLGRDPFEKKTENLGERICEYRRIHGLTQNDLAKRLRVDPATLAGWERTEHIPSNEIRNKLMSIIKKN